MSAVLRVWWTFFTALPLQRLLAGIGAAWCGLLLLGQLVTPGGEGLWILGVVGLFVLVIFPSVFASAAVFRALSAPSANQLLPHFRARMLVGITLFMLAVLAPFALLFMNQPTGSGPTPLEIIGYVLAVSTAIFMWMFVLFGDWRWVWLFIAIPFVLAWVVSTGTTREMLAVIPSWAWPGAAVLAWIVFFAWYVRARRIRPLMYVPQAPAGAWARAELEGTLTRELALRALATGQPPGQKGRALVVRTAWLLAPTVIVVLGAFLFLPAPLWEFFSFTSFVWPFGTMMLLWGHATGIVHRSRLLWLRTPGSRDAVRREIEHALLRNLRGGLLLLFGAAALYVSPLVAAAPQQVLAGFALTACAGLFSTYLALASVPGRALHLVGFGLMMALQFALLGPFKSPLSIGIVTGAELVGALAFRALAMRRWRHVDWLQLRLLPTSNMFRRA
jgi:hypothetical protein